MNILDFRKNVKNIIAELPRKEEKIKKRSKDDITMIVIHNSADDDNQDEADVYKIAKYHTSPGCHVCAEGCPSICYHSYIEKTARKTVIYETAFPEDIVYAVGPWNKCSYNICLDYKNIENLKPDTYRALVYYVAMLCVEFSLNPFFTIFGHRNLETTGWYVKDGIKLRRKSCPSGLSISQLRKDVVDLLHIDLLKSDKDFYNSINLNFLSFKSYDLIIDGMKYKRYYKKEDVDVPGY